MATFDPELEEWLESLEDILRTQGRERARAILQALQSKVGFSSNLSTPYRNTIPVQEEPFYPGNLDLEARIQGIIRWNAMAMVVRANQQSPGIGGHISTYASASTLYEVGFHHFFRGKDHPCGGDFVYIQGHASPGIYARAFLEGRLTEQELQHFRRELASPRGLSSYPHPYLMPKFWEFPTVSMGLGPLCALYHARFQRYLEHRGLKEKTDARVWAFLGDGEMDEPESTASLTLASRENLNNLVFVINCNLQRLDGPVRGNGKIIQELEGVFRGAGWNVVKVIWGSQWNPLIAEDSEGVLLQQMEATLDGQYQKYATSTGNYIREKFFGVDPRLQKLVESYPNERLEKLNRGGHDPLKVYAAYHRAIESTDKPTVILAKTIKGYGLGEAGEGHNTTHQQKKLELKQLKKFRDRFQIPISDSQIETLPFYPLPPESPEKEYLLEQRKKLGGFLPERRGLPSKTSLPPASLYEEFYQGTKDRPVSTTMVFVRILSKLLREKEFGRFIVPIVADEARTFGMEALFATQGIYSPKGQLYEPVDATSLLHYREIEQGQILEEGITEAGAMASWIAAASAYANYQRPTIPFFIFYSMFGFQRIGDLIWAAGDLRARGFLIGATAGRTTLAGEGLQHQDGHSHLLAYPYPHVVAYDPAFAYELAIIVESGLWRMTHNNEDLTYYITVMNENYPMPPLPSHLPFEELKDKVLRGMYCLKPQSSPAKNQTPIHLFGNGAILNEVVKASQILEQEHHRPSTVWSITSFKKLYQDAIQTEAWNRNNPGQPPRKSFLEESLAGTNGIYLIASDYVRALPDSLSRWFPQTPICLGTDGFGLSESRERLREYFEVDAKTIVKSVLERLS